MPCCGQERAALKSVNDKVQGIPPLAPARATAVVAPPNITPVPSKVQPQLGYSSPRRYLQIEYLAASRILVSGPATGTPYEFSAARRVQAMDARDAEVLLKTAFFRLQRAVSS